MIDENGKQFGVVPLAIALEKARKLSTDLVEIAAFANPPVCKLIDFKKFRYSEQKRERAAKKHAKEVEVKEIRLGPFVSDHDLNIRLEKAAEFFKKGNRVKLTVRFTGRQMAHPEFGPAVIAKVMNHFTDKVKVEREAKFEGRHYSLILAPAKPS